MTVDQQTTRSTQRARGAPEPSAAPQVHGGANERLGRAAGFRRVAKEKLEDCDRGLNAKREVERRRNGPGQ